LFVDVPSHHYLKVLYEKVLCPGSTFKMNQKPEWTFDQSLLLLRNDETSNNELHYTHTCHILMSHMPRTCFNYCCCYRKVQVTCAQSFTLWQHATIDITIIACSHHIYIWVLFFMHIPFMVNRTFNATPTERLQHCPSSAIVTIYRFYI